MNGKFLLDTNAVVALLRSNATLIQTLQSAEWVGVSVITELEFLSFSGLSPRDESVFQEFKNRVDVIDLQSSDNKMLMRIIEIRKQNNLKLPDAIIAASAIENNATLLTQDADFSRIALLSVQDF
ncbi:MAG: type II toxin-antitoxin system VapC family toxin [Saprospiraceae bacterium]|nr:type II toxin-antitoxin system VapC family toxin [Saprospiraceae bacterium]